MNKLIALACAMSLVAGSAFAQTAVSGSGSNASSGSSSQAQAGAISSNTYISKGSKIPKYVGAAVAPGLAAGGLSCQGSASGGIGGQGFAVAFGMTKMDRDCNSRENAKTIYLMGLHGAGVETMCDIPQVRAAMARSGTPCYADRAQVAQLPAAGNRPRVQRVSASQIPKFKTMAACRAYAQTHAVTCVIRKK